MVGREAPPPLCALLDRGTPMAEGEREYYKSGNVLVTATRAEMGGRTFAMANVSAVSMSSTKPSPGCALLLLVGGALIALGGLGSLRDGGVGALIGGLVMAGLGFLWWRSLKTVYSVNLGSASGEAKAMQSTNREDIEQIVAAIKQAMIDRG